MPIKTRSMTSGRTFQSSSSIAGKDVSYKSGVQTRRMRNQETFNTRRVTRSMTQSNRDMQELFEAANTLMKMRNSK